MLGEWMVIEVDWIRCQRREWWNLPLDAAKSLFEEYAGLSGYSLVEYGKTCYKAFRYIQDEPIEIYKIELALMMALTDEVEKVPE